ncbi:hypothetical protein DM860_012163 [Cuscuta australis]|uniref:DUF7086 domain-containing protein n=1 Tax=Cuscuta australis TaxID=267555 RepID=A0A328DB27_9ASTE|nr:hypothetical protein DM860_012163 [Cuscuta australis]
MNKRKNREKDSGEDHGGGGCGGDMLCLTLACKGLGSPQPQPFILPPPQPAPQAAVSPPAHGHDQPLAAPFRQVRQRRRNPSQGPREGKSETIAPPFPWATELRATVQPLSELLSKGISVITGEVQCKRCEHAYEMEFDLEKKFYEVGNFIRGHKTDMHERAPEVWRNPVLPACKFCDQENSVKPVIASSKKAINWLFLLLGQLLGCCTLEQLRYFCKHTKNHRTGAKDRVLYLTYLNLCKQLDPAGPFDRC